MCTAQATLSGGASTGAVDAGEMEEEKGGEGGDGSGLIEGVQVEGYTEEEVRDNWI